MSGDALTSRLYRLSRTSRGLALWIPSKLVDALGLHAGDKVTLQLLQDGSILVKKSSGGEGV